MTLDDFLASLFPQGAPKQPGGQTPNDLILASLNGAMPRADSNSGAGGDLSGAAGLGAPRVPGAPRANLSQAEPRGRLALPAPQVSGAPTAGAVSDPDVFDRMGAFSAGYGAGGLLGGIANAVKGPDAAVAAKRQQIQNNNQTYKALLQKGLSPEQAMTVVTNPEIAKEVIPKLFSPTAEKPTDLQQNYEFARRNGYQGSFTDFMRVNQNDPGSRPPSGFRYTADGNLEAIPGGPADKQTEAKFSEGAARAANFANMMDRAEVELKPFTESPLDFWGSVREGVLPEGAANPTRSSEYQKYRQAAMQWVRAKLRKESGAQISPSEFEGDFQTYFPQYGDGPEVIAQKTAARREATEGMKAESRGAFGNMFGQRQAPQAGAVMDGYRFKGGDPADQKNWERVQ